MICRRGILEDIDFVRIVKIEKTSNTQKHEISKKTGDENYGLSRFILYILQKHQILSFAVSAICLAVSFLGFGVFEDFENLVSFRN
jgi:hypothetical protein